MAQTLYATNNFTGNGITTAWTISWQGGYLNTADVKARYFDSVGEAIDIPVTSVVGSVVTISPAVIAGREFQIYRDTQKGTPLVDYSDGSILNEENLDTTTRQAVFVSAEAWDLSFDTRGVAQEARESANNALAQAAAATTAASAAQASAASASASAAAAASSASSAQSSAAIAANNASIAVSTANNALNVANGISTTATTALNTANTANSTANAALAGVNGKLASGGDAFTGDTTMPDLTGFLGPNGVTFKAATYGWRLNLGGGKAIDLGGTNSAGADGIKLSNTASGVFSCLYKPTANGQPVHISTDAAKSAPATGMANNNAGMRINNFTVSTGNAFEFRINLSGAESNVMSATYDGDLVLGRSGRTTTINGTVGLASTTTYDRGGIRHANDLTLGSQIFVQSSAGATLTVAATTEYHRSRVGYFAMEQMRLKFTADVTGGTGAGNLNVYATVAWSGASAPASRASNLNARFPVQYLTVNGVYTECYAKMIPGTETFAVPRWNFFRKATDVAIKDNEMKNNDEIMFVVTYPISTFV